MPSMSTIADVDAAFGLMVVIRNVCGPFVNCDESQTTVLYVHVGR